jgi:signal transduction histidine kinase
MKYYLTTPKNIRFFVFIILTIALLISLSAYILSRLQESERAGALQRSSLAVQNTIFQKLILVQSKVLSHQGLLTQHQDDFSEFASIITSVNQSIFGVELRNSSGELLKRYTVNTLHSPAIKRGEPMPPWVFHQFTEAVDSRSVVYSQPYSANLLNFTELQLHNEYVIEQYIPLDSGKLILVVLMSPQVWLSSDFISDLTKQFAHSGYQLFTDSGLVIASTFSSNAVYLSSAAIPFGLPGLKLNLRAETSVGLQKLADLTLPTLIGISLLIAILIIVFVRSLYLQSDAERRIRAQEEIILDRERLASLGEMTSVLSHEINQPIAAIETYASAAKFLLESEDLIDRKQMLTALDGVSNQAHRAAETIKGIRKLFTSKSTAEELILISDVLKGIEAMFSIQAERYKARFTITYEFDSKIMVNRLLCEQVFLNLARNSFQAMEGVKESQRLLKILVSQKDGKSCYVGFIDRGKGISKELEENLFKPFFSSKKDGMGIGLSLSRTLVERFGGQLSWQNLPEGGAEFGIQLPIHA